MFARFGGFAAGAAFSRRPTGLSRRRRFTAAFRSGQQGLLHFTTLAHFGVFRRGIARTIGFDTPFPWQDDDRFSPAQVPPSALAAGAAVSAATLLATDRRADGFFRHLEVDLALVEIDAHDPHFNGVAKTEAATGTLTRQAVMHRIEVVVIARQRSDVHQAFDVDVGQLDEQTKPVTAVITPGNDSPTRSFMNSHLSQFTTSRVASSARRSLIEHCSPSCSRAASSYG
jgi:hypothetical protein